MKRYFLHSVVWVQIVILSIVTFFTLGRNYIDSFVFNFVHFYPFESMINGVINIFYNDILFFSIILPFFLKYFLSILPLLLLIVCFLSISFTLGGIIGVIWYFIRRKKVKEAKKTSNWVKNILIFELIFTFSVLITYLLWLIPHNDSYSIENDETSILFCFIFLISFPFFMLGQFLRQRNIKLLGNASLILTGIILVFGIAISFYSYQKADSFYDPTKIESDDYDDYDDYDGEDYEEEDYGDYEDYEEDVISWDFDVFNASDLQEIFDNKNYLYNDKYSYYTLDNYLKPSENADFNEENKTLFKLYDYVDRNSEMLELFWNHFGNMVVTFVNENKEKFNFDELDYLLKTYEIEDNNEDLFEDILEELNKQEAYECQLYSLIPIFEKHNIPQYKRDIENSKIDNADVRWAYTFWARRYQEENIQITQLILENLKSRITK